MIRNKLKSKGFTLIELMLVLTITSILLSYSFINLTGVNTLQNDIEAETFGNVMVNFINNSREYCRDKNIDGCIYFDEDRKDLTLNCGLEEIRKLQLPDKFALVIGRSDKKIQINNGEIVGATKIIFIDRKGEKHHVTVCVGSAYVDFKEEKGIYAH
ncbi:type II secretion system protein [Clostridium sp. JS66]|uniref:type II secretion system protein n=1 Tax=Clostridium sp. JS66 TaxID=3064705 RepID=UPI00298E4E9C|nr:type II secretion system protein [Clostridium sp. JS66]WPC40930.1 type II secretion system protein [Clostridium sp. JS66]